MSDLKAEPRSCPVSESDKVKSRARDNEAGVNSNENLKTETLEAQPAKRTSVKIFKLDHDAPAIRSAQSERRWMDETIDRAAYRCTPMTVANSAGWYVENKTPFTATWTGGKGVNDIIFRGPFPPNTSPPFAASHFGNGVLTFQTGHLFKTEPGWGVWSRGMPNMPKHGIMPLEGIVETDWLAFTFTMNWVFTQPGTVFFDAGEPICFVTPVNYAELENVDVSISSIDSDPELKKRFHEWRVSRDMFNRKLHMGYSEQQKQKWQKNYTRGVYMDGSKGSDFHKTKIRFPEPKT